MARDRFDHLRRFCLYAHAEDRQHQVPRRWRIRERKRRRPTPHIIEPEQVQAIMQAALDLPPKGKINPHTYHYLLGCSQQPGYDFPKRSHCNAGISPPTV